MKRNRKQKQPSGPAFLVNAEFATTLHTLSALDLPPAPKAGPNKWDEVTSKDFGPQEDYRVQYEGSLVILHPVSEAALQWCYAKLPEDCPRWGAHGFVIEARYWPTIEAGLKRDNLMSRQEFEDAMNEEENLRRQREGDDQWQNQE